MTSKETETVTEEAVITPEETKVEETKVEATEVVKEEKPTKTNKGKKEKADESVVVMQNILAAAKEKQAIKQKKLYAEMPKIVMVHN